MTTFAMNANGGTAPTILSFCWRNHFGIQKRISKNKSVLESQKKLPHSVAEKKGFLPVEESETCRETFGIERMMEAAH